MGEPAGLTCSHELVFPVDDRLHRTGYGVGRYLSLEQLVIDSKDGYYSALGLSTLGWFDDGHHDMWPWARYLLGRVDEAYTRFEQRVAAGRSGGADIYAALQFGPSRTGSATSCRG